MSASTDSRLHFEGVLEKAGKRFFEGFRKRWFILDGQDLTYYKAPETTEENYLGTIDFSQVKAVNPVKLVNNGFQIITRNRTYTFSAQTPENLTEWVSVLRQAMQLQKFSSQKKQLSSQDSIDSQYDLPMNRPNRSLSSPSDRSFDSDDLDSDLYSSVSDSGGKAVLPGDDPGGYSMVGAGSLPRQSVKNADETMYETVGSRPPSKSAPPTYEMVQAASASVKEETAEGHADSALYDSVLERNESAGFYDLVQTGDTQESKETKPPSVSGSLNQGDQLTREKKAPVDVAELYSKPDISKKQRSNKQDTRGLSIIAEDDDDNDDNDNDDGVPLRTVEETSPPLPPRMEVEAFAIYEIKRILEEAKEDENEEILGKEGEDQEEVFVDEKISAFERLKEFLQRLDSKEEQ